MDRTLLIGVIIAGLSVLCTVLSKFNPYRLNIMSFAIGIILIFCGALNVTGIGSLIIMLGLFSFVFSIIMYSKVIPGPWTFGFDFVLLFIWLEYLLNQLLVPVTLIFYGIEIL